VSATGELARFAILARGFALTIVSFATIIFLPCTKAGRSAIYKKSASGNAHREAS
jgi:hypothetical protein